MSAIDIRRGAVLLALALLWIAALVINLLVPAAGRWLGLAVAAAGLAYAGWLLVRVVWPLSNLERAAADLARGEPDAMSISFTHSPVVERLRRALSAMASHVQRAQLTGQAHLAAVDAAQEAERARLARELHDVTVQTLIAIAQRLDRANRLAATDPERTRAILVEARQDAMGAIDDLREIIAGLRPPALDELGLVPALELVVDRLPPSLAASLNVGGPARRLAPERELGVLRIVQEALSNVLRHSEATRVTVDLHYEPKGLRITVDDNGRGFAAHEVLARAVDTGHWGLIGMQERAAHLGGSLNIDTAPGRGTRVTLHLPDSAGEQPSAEVVDPVCKATIEPATAYGSVEHAGQTYYFCCPVCQGAFQRNPERYSTS